MNVVARSLDVNRSTGMLPSSGDMLETRNRESVYLPTLAGFATLAKRDLFAGQDLPQLIRVAALTALSWRRERDSNSCRSFRICNLQILRCQGCRECQRCRGALHAVARTAEVDCASPGGANRFPPARGRRTGVAGVIDARVRLGPSSAQFRYCSAGTVDPFDGANDYINRTIQDDRKQ